MHSGITVIWLLLRSNLRKTWENNTPHTKSFFRSPSQIRQGSYVSRYHRDLVVPKIQPEKRIWEQQHITTTFAHSIIFVRVPMHSGITVIWLLWRFSLKKKKSFYKAKPFLFILCHRSALLGAKSFQFLIQQITCHVLRLPLQLLQRSSKNMKKQKKETI